MELRQLNPAVAVRGPHCGDVGTDAVEPDDAVYPRPLEQCLAFQLHTELGEERFGSLEVAVVRRATAPAPRVRIGSLRDWHYMM